MLMVSNFRNDECEKYEINGNQFSTNAGNDKDTSIQSDTSDKSKPEKRKVIIISWSFELLNAKCVFSFF